MTLSKEVVLEALRCCRDVYPHDQDFLVSRKVAGHTILADGDTFTISGTKMRRAAFAGDFKSFKAGIPTLNDKDVMTLMSEIKSNLPKNFK